MAFSIYKLFSKENPTNIRYIGQTIEKLNIRLSKHKATARCNIYKRSSYLVKWIRKNNYNIGIELIEEVNSKKELNDKEVYYIKFYKELGYKLVNTTLGADETTTLFYHENGNSKKVLQYDLEGNYLNTYLSIKEAGEKNNIKPGLISGNISLDRIKSAGGFIWKYYIDDFPIKINKYESICGEKAKKELSKIILQYDINMKFIKEWESLHTIENTLKYSRQSISNSTKTNKIYKDSYWKLK